MCFIVAKDYSDIKVAENTIEVEKLADVTFDLSKGTMDIRGTYTGFRYYKGKVKDFSSVHLNTDKIIKQWDRVTKGFHSYLASHPITTGLNSKLSTSSLIEVKLFISAYIPVGSQYMINPYYSEIVSQHIVINKGISLFVVKNNELYLIGTLQGLYRHLQEINNIVDVITEW